MADGSTYASFCRFIAIHSLRLLACEWSNFKCFRFMTTYLCFSGPLGWPCWSKKCVGTLSLKAGSRLTSLAVSYLVFGSLMIRTRLLILLVKSAPYSTYASSYCYLRGSTVAGWVCPCVDCCMGRAAPGMSCLAKASNPKVADPSLLIDPCQF